MNWNAFHNYVDDVKRNAFQDYISGVTKITDVTKNLGHVEFLDYDKARTKLWARHACVIFACCTNLDVLAGVLKLCTLSLNLYYLRTA